MTVMIDIHKTKIINFFGAPGAGKTTKAYQTAYGHKSQGLTAELITEVARELAYTGWSGDKLDTSFMSTFVCMTKVYSYLGKADYVINDSPPLASLMYKDMAGNLPEEQIELLLNSYPMRWVSDPWYGNVGNFLVTRNPNKVYVKDPGRLHTLEESNKVHTFIKSWLDKYQIPYIEIEGGV